MPNGSAPNARRRMGEQGGLITDTLARADLYFYARYMFLRRRKFHWERAAHHKTICNALERVFRGECKRLIINVPPRYSKTALVGVNFMTWCLGKAPDSEFIYTSYSASLATNAAWEARELVSSEAYQEIFPNTTLRTDSAAKHEWRPTEGGCVYAVGSGGTITGYGAGKMRDSFGGAIIIDDPNKPEDIRSDIIRKGVLDWFPMTLETRKNSPNTPIILIMQRLHEEDLAGWLLDGGNGEEWESIVLPAIQGDGTALWPEKHSIERLRQMEQANPYAFAGQYMQRPTPEAGGLFKPDEITYCDSAPNIVKWVRAWDLAATQEDGDWTVGVLMGHDAARHTYIADVVRLQGRPDDVEKAIVATAYRDTRKIKISIPQDPGQAGKSQVTYLTRALAGFPVVATLESGDKVTRAEPFASQVNMGSVSMVRGEWNNGLVNEMRYFPFGKHDDQIDGCSRAFNHLMEAKAPWNISDQLLDKLKYGGH